MIYSGFTDEAGREISKQIQACKELGWQHIELRQTGFGGTIHDISDEDFDKVFDALGEAGIHVHCFGSAIATGGSSILKPFEETLRKVDVAIPRMLRLDCCRVRIMSYPLLKDRAPDAQMEEERFRRLREIQHRFAEHGIMVMVENCNDYCNMSSTHALRLLENVPGLKLIFDPGNLVLAQDFTKDEPRPFLSPWEFYRSVREHIAHVHIKDRLRATGEHVFPGDGDGDVERIVADLVATGYDGAFSMEPHMKEPHPDIAATEPEDWKLAQFVEYGRRFMKIVARIEKTALCYDLNRRR